MPIQHPQPAHQQSPPPSAQDDLLPLDLSMKSTNTTPIESPVPKPEVNDENLDDVDDDQPVVIDGVHKMMMTCQILKHHTVCET